MIKVGDKIQTKENYKYLVPNCLYPIQNKDWNQIGVIYAITNDQSLFNDEIDLIDLQTKQVFHNLYISVQFLCITFMNGTGAQIPVKNWERYIKII